MDNDEAVNTMYRYAVQIVAQNDILRKQVEMVRFALGHEANTNGTQWARELLDAMEQVGRVKDER